MITPLPTPGIASDRQLPFSPRLESTKQGAIQVQNTLSKSVFSQLKQQVGQRSSLFERKTITSREPETNQALSSDTTVLGSDRQLP